VVPTKKLLEHTQKLAILNQLQIHFKAKHEKGVGTPFPRVPAPLIPCLSGNLPKQKPPIKASVPQAPMRLLVRPH